MLTDLNAKKNLKTRRWLFMSLLVVNFSAAIYFSRVVSAANVTWDGGGGTNNWSEPANWSGDVVPGSADTAFFDGTSTKDATIDVNINVRGIRINSGYTGTITQSSSSTITVGADGLSQSSGTFSGGSSDIDLANEFDLNGGTFTSTTGTLIPRTSYVHDGGTFNHNNGTVTCNGSGGSLQALAG